MSLDQILVCILSWLPHALLLVLAKEVVVLWCAPGIQGTQRWIYKQDSSSTDISAGNSGPGPPYISSRCPYQISPTFIPGLAHDLAHSQPMESGSWLRTRMWFFRPDHRQLQRFTWQSSGGQLPTPTDSVSWSLRTQDPGQSHLSHLCIPRPSTFIPRFLYLQAEVLFRCLWQGLLVGGRGRRHLEDTLPTLNQYQVLTHSQPFPLSLPPPLSGSTNLPEPFVQGFLNNEMTPLSVLTHLTQPVHCAWGDMDRTVSISSSLVSCLYQHCNKRLNSFTFGSLL